MFALSPVFVILLAASTAQAGSPQYTHGRWILTDGNPQYEDFYAQEVEDLWPESFPEVAELATLDQNVMTTPDMYVMEEQDEVDDSAVWKIVLVVVVLLVSIVGSLSTAYYMCVWRGGRIHYKPQAGGDA